MRTSSKDIRVYSAEGVGFAIKQLREQAGLSQQDLAQRTGLNRTYIATLESGEPTEQLRRIVDLLRDLDARIVITTDATW